MVFDGSISREEIEAAARTLGAQGTFPKWLVMKPSDFERFKELLDLENEEVVNTMTVIDEQGKERYYGEEQAADAVGDPQLLQVSRCPDCGSPIWAKLGFQSGTEPNNIYTCRAGCRFRPLKTDVDELLKKGPIEGTTRIMEGDLPEGGC